MATIVTRSGKGSALTHSEMDANFNNLNNGKVESVASISDLVNASTSNNYNVLNYHSDVEGGGGVFYWDATKAKSEHNGGTIIDPTATFPTDWSVTTQQETWFNTSNAGVGVWVRQYEGAVNVKWFGAKGDGVTDDTVILQQTSNIQTASIFIPNGTYIVNHTISFTSKSVKGESKDLTILDFQLCNDTKCVHLDVYFRSTFENLSIRGNSNSDEQYAIYGYYVTDGSSIRDVVIRETGFNGIYLERSWYATLENIRIRGGVGTGLTYFGSSVGGVNNIHAKGVYVAGHKNSLKINAEDYTCEGNSFNTCSFENCSETPVVLGGNFQVNALSFDGCYFENTNLTEEQSNAEVCSASVDTSNSLILTNCVIRPNLASSSKFLFKNIDALLISNYMPQGSFQLKEVGSTGRITFFNNRLSTSGLLKNATSHVSGEFKDILEVRPLNSFESNFKYDKSLTAFTQNQKTQTPLAVLKLPNDNTSAYFSVRFVFRSTDNTYTSWSVLYDVFVDSSGGSNRGVYISKNKYIGNATYHEGNIDTSLGFSGNISFNNGDNTQDVTLTFNPTRDDLLGVYALEVEGLQQVSSEDFFKAGVVFLV